MGQLYELPSIFPRNTRPKDKDPTIKDLVGPINMILLCPSLVHMTPLSISKVDPRVPKCGPYPL